MRASASSRSLVVLVAAASFAAASASSCAKGTVTLGVGGGFVTAGGGGGTGGTGAGGQPFGDAGADASISCLHASDCTAMADACNVGACLNNVCVKTPANEGATCDDGLYCTENDACSMGTCVGTPKMCPGADACIVGTCDEPSKSCKTMPGDDGATCTPKNDLCYTSGLCASGACIGTTATDCSFLSDPCNVGICDPMTGCTKQAKADGTFCSTGQFCTVNEACMNGMCVGSPRPCPPTSSPCQLDTCIEALFSCETSQAPDGTACSTSDPCIVGQACAGGTCGGGTPAADGTPCPAPSACLANSVCTAGKCGGTPITACTNGDGCCPTGCTPGNDSDCASCSTDLALAATPSMSIGGLPPGHGAAELNDGVGKSMCQDYAWVTSSPSPSGAHFELLWQNPVTIGSFYVEAAASNGQGPCVVSPGRNLFSADVQTWDGTTWNTVRSFTGESGDVQVDLNPPVMTSRLRLDNVTTSAGTGNALIWEWHVFGGQGCIPPAD